ncbi:hypothetical protein EVAR_41379_1 [Eumeta japonica]|uniref:Uncharacterized protein n=1 Tax=Eumeta variegata TaxID=151549 RepID=A0A4C1WZ33_EUMVA|nr:hypothetical protein EVAR_41379_1 [Eumeta japonica]
MVVAIHVMIMSAAEGLRCTERVLLSVNNSSFNLFVFRSKSGTFSFRGKANKLKSHLRIGGHRCPSTLASSQCVVGLLESIEYLMEQLRGDEGGAGHLSS